MNVLILFVGQILRLRPPAVDCAQDDRKERAAKDEVAFEIGGLFNAFY